MTKITDASFAGVWERTIQPRGGNMTPEAAGYFLRLQFSEADHRRMDQLAANARDGSLASDEEAELSNYMQLGWFLDLVKSKARVALGIRHPHA